LAANPWLLRKTLADPYEEVSTYGAYRYRAHAATRPYPREKKYLSTRDLASLMSVTPDTARHWVAIGAVPSVRIGGTRRIRRADIEEIFEKEKLQTLSQPPQKRGKRKQGDLL